MRTLLQNQEKNIFLTDGAVGTHPVGITATKPRVGQVGTVPTALIWTLGSGKLTIDSTPTRAAETFPIHTDSVVGARGI